MLRKTPLALLLVIAVAMAGCSPATTFTPAPARTSSAASATATVPPTPAAQLYPQTHTDTLNRSVTISAKPMRIVSLAACVEMKIRYRNESMKASRSRKLQKKENV
jgi:ABC-type Fe3+-hydroxamate transport system substrate-binding protein